MAAEAIQQEEKHMVVKRFLIPANAIARLREELICKENNKGLRRPSRTEAITALVWAAVIKATPPTQTVTLSCMVDLRGRMEPPLPPNCLGNLTYGATAHCEAAKDGAAVTAVQLVEKIRDSLRAVNDGAARKMYGEGGLLRAAFVRAMKVEVRSKEMIRPTRESRLKNYKLSRVDQTALNFRVPFVLFYNSPTSNSNPTIDELKKSLSKALSLMYPLAGRMKEDKVTIECNDEGVEFIVADVAENLSCLLENPKMEAFRELIPRTAAYEPRPEGKVLLMIQVNRFRCGGMAMAAFVSHAIADALTVATLFKTWATINRGCEVNGTNGFVFEHSRIFPPLTDTSGIERMFVFPANAISKLREKLTVKDTKTGAVLRPSRTEALTALVWAAVINATPTVNPHRLSSMVNLRGRMEPPFPANCIGNLVHGTTVEWEEKEGIATAVKLVRKVRDSLWAVNDGAARKMYGEGGLLRAALAGGDEIVRKGESDSKKDSSSYWEVAQSLSSFLENPDFEMIRQMVPCNPFTGAFEPNPDARVLVVQVNRFSCGGMSIGLIISHAIGDGVSITVFADAWARINRGCAAVDDGEIIFDASKLFPPVKDTAALDQFARVVRGTGDDKDKYVVRRFYIPASAIDQLREQLRLISHYRPSRAEALIAVVWDAVIAANQERHKGRINLHVLTSIINIRNRMEPPFPANCLGNNTFGATAHWNQPTDGNPSRHALAAKFRDAVRGVNDEAARKRYGKGGLLHTMLPIMSEIIKHEGAKKNMYCLYTSSLLGMQVYAADFGWGKPRLAVNAQVMKDTVVFMEGKFGGVDLWMGLPEELMDIVVKVPQFAEFVSAGFSKSKI
nr:vinorine synthase-like [Ipomoea batatas]